jgi:uncharacterized phage protein (TIGR01671 family)
MREHKYRAWDEQNNEWIKAKNVGLLIQTALAYPKTIILEEYTGRKDENLKELYENDIITAVWHCTVCFDTSPHELTGTIEWNNENSMFMFDYGHGVVPLASEELDGIVKVGNIHENKDLL